MRMTIPRWNWPALAAVLWVCGVSGIAVEAYLRPRGRTVFDIYAVAGHRWWAGEDLYTRQVETREFFRYSPAAAIALRPFVALPPGAGNAAWKVANAGVFLFGTWVWCRRGVPRPLSRNQTAWVFLLASPLAMTSLHIGQANLMTTGFVLLGLAAAAQDRWWRAAAFVAAATLIKVFPIALALLLGSLYWRQFPLRFAVVLAAGLVLPFLAQSPDVVARQYESWYTHLTESNDLNYDRLRSLNMMLGVYSRGAPDVPAAFDPQSKEYLAERDRRWFSQSRILFGPLVFTLIGTAAGGLVFAACAWSARWSDRRALLTRAGAWFFVWVLLFSPATENPTYSIVAPVIAWAAVESFRGGGPWAWVSGVVLLTSIFLMGPSVTDVTTPHGREFLDRYTVTTLGAVLFQLWLIANLVRDWLRSKSGAVEAEGVAKAEVTQGVN
ncbi:hypothetical protein FRUB_01515 [Fimbriiglobus ruber]|uniref:Uncharacterized protein n=2 Tax=Fimbriiglobus ruber TaxID=1908690 RepID=A0A225E044_9BACT|nr:hypothetical protein FRUB_01515 [Fimbriiglobus ruber]